MLSTVDRDGAPGDEELSPVFDRTVGEGDRRLTRTWPGLLATGWVGGMDVGFIALVACAGNMVGGVGVVTLLRLVQVGRQKVDHERMLSEKT